jgi:hypothetical protein
MPSDELTTSAVSGVGVDAPRAAEPRSPVWSFLNSSFGIFLLSSVALGLISFGYSSWRDYTVDNRKIEQLDLEIASRLSAVQAMAIAKENNRYSNLVNISKVIDGSVDVSFYVRKPIFNEFDNKNLSSLMWQLYLLLPSAERGKVKDAIGQTNQLVSLMRSVRRNITDNVTLLPTAKGAKAQEKQDDEDDKLKKDYGQSEIFKDIEALNRVSRWSKLAVNN